MRWSEEAAIFEIIFNNDVSDRVKYELNVICVRGASEVRVNLFSVFAFVEIFELVLNVNWRLLVIVRPCKHQRLFFSNDIFKSHWRAKFRTSSLAGVLIVRATHKRFNWIQRLFQSQTHDELHWLPIAWSHHTTHFQVSMQFLNLQAEVVQSLPVNPSRIEI